MSKDKELREAIIRLSLITEHIIRDIVNNGTIYIGSAENYLDELHKISDSVDFKPDSK